MLTQQVLKLLKSEALRCAVVNRYAEPAASSCLQALGCREIRDIPLTCYLPPVAENRGDAPSRVPASRQTKAGLLYHYSLNVSSVLPVLALQLQSRDSVLDMCAAPGGKAFAILQQISLEGGLAVNEPISSRLARLRRMHFPVLNKTDLDVFPAPAVLDKYIMGGGKNYVRLVWAVECLNHGHTYNVAI